MKHLFNIILFLFLSLIVFPGFAQEREREVLVFHKTDGFWHKSIPTGQQAIEELGEENRFAVEVTDDAGVFNRDDLKKFGLVIFLNTTGDVLDDEQQKAFEDYMNSGGNFFGIHAAADTEKDWEWYGKLVGAYFLDHPAVQKAEIIVEKQDHPTVSHLPERWERKDEWYNYKEINPEIEVLMRLDETTYEGGKNPGFHPIAWYRELPGGGRSIYTGGGHTIESYIEPEFLEHLRRCILFGLGEPVDKEK